MTATTYMTDVITRRQVFIERFAGGETNEALAFLRRLREYVQQRLATDPNALQAQRLSTLLADIEATAKDLYAEAGTNAVDRLEDFALDHGEFVQDMLNRASNDATQFLLPTDAQLVQAITGGDMLVPLGTSQITVEQAIKDFADTKTSELMRTINTGILTGETNAQIIGRVSDLITNRQRHHTEALVRTVVNHAANQVQMAVYRENQALIAGYEWVSVLDMRTSLLCFDGSTRFAPCGVVKNIFRTQYSGEFITIRTASGYEITGTFNHPILTEVGFVPLGKLEPSDKIVTAVGGDVGGVGTRDNVEVIPTIGEVFDSLNRLALFDVFWESASETDFYGDGAGINGKVAVINTESLLVSDGEARFDERISDCLLTMIKDAVSFFGGSSFEFHLNSYIKSDMPSQLSVRFFEDLVDECLGAVNDAGNFGGLRAFLKHVQNALSVFSGLSVSSRSGDIFHQADFLEEVGNGCSGLSIASSDGSGGLPASVSLDDVVSVVRETGSRHVYTLEVDSLGLYFANSIAVKNCAGRDGRIYKVGKGPVPPAHFRCRSGTVPRLLKDYERKRISPPDGKIDHNVNFGAWLKKQPQKFQDEYLGPTRAQLFRDGGLQVDRFRDEAGRVYTLAELKDLAPMAFEEAGLSNAPIENAID